MCKQTALTCYCHQNIVFEINLNISLIIGEKQRKSDLLRLFHKFAWNFSSPVCIGDVSPGTKCNRIWSRICWPLLLIHYKVHAIHRFRVPECYFAPKLSLTFFFWRHLCLLSTWRNDSLGMVAGKWHDLPPEYSRGFGWGKNKIIKNTK